MDWVNLPTPVTDDLLDLMLKHHADVFSPFADRRWALRELIEKVRRWLQLAWKAADDPARCSWWLFRARQEYSRALIGGMPGSKRNFDYLNAHAGGSAKNVTDLLDIVPPLETAFDSAVTSAQMSYCQGPNCEEPYFLRGPKRERYCPECKHAARLRSKKRYYYAKGKFNR